MGEGSSPRGHAPPFPLLLRNAAAYGLARGIPGIVGFLALATYTRLLSREQYGAYTLAVAAAGLTYAMAFQWLSLGVLRLVKSGRWGREVFLSSVLQCFAAGLLAVVVVAAALVVTHRLADPGLILIGVLLVAAQVWVELNLALAIAESDPVRYGKMAGTRAVVGFGAGATLGLLGFGVKGVLLGVVAGYLVGGLWAAVRCWGGVAWRNGQPEVRRTLVVYGFPLTVTYLLDFVVSTSDRVLLGAMRGPEAAGTYGAAYDLCQQSIWALMIILTQSAYPVVVEAFERGGIRDARRPLLRHGVLLAGIAVPAATGLAVLAPSITGVVLPASYAAEMRSIVPLVAAAVLLGGLKSYYLDFSFQLGHRTQGQMAAVALAATTNLGLNLLWIPRLGALGAAYATLTAYSVGLGASWLLGRRVIALPIPGRELLRIAAAALGMALVLWPVRVYVGVGALSAQLALGVLSYLGFALLVDIGGSRATLARAWRHYRGAGTR